MKWFVDDVESLANAAHSRISTGVFLSLLYLLSIGMLVPSFAYQLVAVRSTRACICRFDPGGQNRIPHAAARVVDDFSK